MGAPIRRIRLHKGCVDNPDRPKISAVPGLYEAIATHGKASEATVRAEVEVWLKSAGYGKPPEGGPAGFYVLAGQRNTMHSGSDSGVQDLTVLVPGKTWAIELKARDANAEIKQTQYAMWARGCLHIVNTVDQVKAILA